MIVLREEVAYIQVKVKTAPGTSGGMVSRETVKAAPGKS